MNAARQHLRALRPEQWTKNIVVFAAFLFAIGDSHQQVSEREFWRVLLAALAFCLASSGVYLLNDVRDRDEDRRHPQKKYRPVASGAVSPVAALAMAGVLLPVALLGGCLIARPFGLVLAGYVALQITYTLMLKHLAVVDVLVIAAGFVLRAMGGAVAIAVEVSPWLLVCAFFLAVFLALCKRRQEFMAWDPAAGAATRNSLHQYDERLLDQLIAIAAACTLVGYTIYTLAPETVDKYGTTRLSYTLLFVVFGLFRYLHLVYRHELGERPERVLLTDLPLLVNLALYGTSVLLILQ